MEHHKAGARATRFGPKEYFTGTALQDPIIEAPEPARVRAARVTFLPGARTNWHTHPLGQTLYIVSGVGRFQSEGQKVVAFRAGDTIWIPPGEKHWHGSAPETAMCHIAIQETDGTGPVNWLEPVSEEDYAAEP